MRAMSNSFSVAFSGSIRTALAVLLVLAVIFGASTPAQAKELSEQKLNQVLHRYAGIQNLEVDFKQLKVFKDISLKLRSEGHLTVERPDRLVWRVTKPSRIDVEIRKSEVTITSGQGADQTIQKFQPNQNQDPQARSLHAIAAWFSLDPNLLVKDYRVEEVGPLKYSFHPRDPSQTPFTALEIRLASNGILKETTIFERSGDRLEITFGEPTIKKGETKK